MKHLPKFALFFLLASPVFAAERDAVVKIVGQDSVRGQYQGSGVCVDPSGIILTARHVVAKTTERSRLVFFGEKSYRITDSWIPSSEDVAVLKVNGKDLPYLKIAITEPSKGDRVWGMGFGKGIYQSNHGRIVTKAVRFSRRGPPVIWGTTISVEHGQSGGPLVDSKWGVLGILSVGSLDTSFAPGFDPMRVFANDTKWESGYLNLVRIQVAMSQFTGSDKQVSSTTKRTLYAFVTPGGT